MMNANGPKKCTLIVKTKLSLGMESQGMFTNSFVADIEFNGEPNRKSINNATITIIDNFVPLDKLKFIEQGYKLEAEVFHNNGNEYFLHTILRKMQ